MTHALIAIGLILVCAKLLEGVATRLNQSSLLAYVIVGIFLGLFLETGEELELFFSIGVFFLFFLIGIDEIDISGFVETLRGRFFCAAVISFLIPFSVNFMVLLFIMDFPTAIAVALASILALSSLGIAASVLGDLGHLKKPIGLEIFTTVVIIEILGLLVAGFALEQSGHAGNFGWLDIAILLLEIIGFVVVAWVLSAKVVPPLLIALRKFVSAPQLAFGLMIGGLFLVVEGAEGIGMDGALAALVFGMVNSGLPRRLRNDILPTVRGLAHGMFIPLFFASAGLNLDMSFTDLPITTLAVIIPALIVGKLAGTLVGVLATRLDKPLAVASGIMGKGVIEIALLLIMLEENLITQELFSLLTILMVGFIVLVPPAMNFSINRSKDSRRPTFPNSIVPSFARYSLQGILVEDILDRGRRFANEDLTIQQFMERWAGPERQDYVISGKDHNLAGVLSLRHIRKTPNERWPITKISALINRNPMLASPNDTLDDFLEKMAEHRISVFPVVDTKSGEFLGSVGTNDVLKTMIEGKSDQSH